MITPNYETGAAGAPAQPHEILDESQTLASLTAPQWAHLALGISRNFGIAATHDADTGFATFTHSESGAFLRKPDVISVIEAWQLAAHIWQCMEGGDE